MWLRLMVSFKSVLYPIICPPIGMEVSLVENIEAQLENSITGSTLDLSLIGKGKDFRKLNSYLASIFILLLVVSRIVI